MREVARSFPLLLYGSRLTFSADVIIIICLAYWRVSLSKALIDSLGFGDARENLILRTRDLSCQSLNLNLPARTSGRFALVEIRQEGNLLERKLSFSIIPWWFGTWAMIC